MKLYNTLTRKKEELKPIKPGQISMYVCGPTVYDYCHLGHAKGYVSMDIIRRYLIWSGLKVKYVQNFTDVGHLTDDADSGEDKIEKRAMEQKVEPKKLVAEYIEAYYTDFHKLNVLDPDVAPRPSEHIPEIIEFIKDLIKNGFAYEANGSVYFDIGKFKDYGKLSGKKIEDLIAGKRIAVRAEKKNPADFALWIKADEAHIMKWESPWSVGYPGWHIECSVMSRKYLGDTFDIHGGGNENIFPHNESEIAQSEALTGKQMAHYWLLWNMVMVEGAKMSKSKGNFTCIKDLLEKYDPMVVRLAIIKTHYRSPINFSEGMFEEASKNLLEIRNVVEGLRAASGKSSQNNLNVSELVKGNAEKFKVAMDDDFNTPLAFSVFFSLIQIAANHSPANFTKPEANMLLETIYDLDQVLGLGLKEYKHVPVPQKVKDLCLERDKARKAGDFKKSDELRTQIEKAGYLVEDTAEGSSVRKK